MFFAVHLKVTGRCFWMTVSDTRKSLGALLTSLQMSLLMSDSVLRARSLSTPHVVHISVPGQSKLFDTTSSIYPQLVRLLVKSRAPPVTPFQRDWSQDRPPSSCLGSQRSACLLEQLRKPDCVCTDWDLQMCTSGSLQTSTGKSFAQNLSFQLGSP